MKLKKKHKLQKSIKIKINRNKKNEKKFKRNTNWRIQLNF
jgi:hypothetical protein